MDLEQLQIKHRKFVEDMGWAFSKTPLECVALIHEEAAELGKELRQPVLNKIFVGQELADIILRTIDLAKELEIDISQALLNKVKYNINNIKEHKAKGRKV